MAEFGPWRMFPEIPKLGDYVQVEGRKLFLTELIRVEGIVTSIQDGGLDLTPPVPCFLHLHRWRLRKLPEHKIETTREKELEDA